MWAALQGHVHSVETMLRAGADTQVRCQVAVTLFSLDIDGFWQEGATALEHAVSAQELDVVDMLSVPCHGVQSESSVLMEQSLEADKSRANDVDDDVQAAAAAYCDAPLSGEESGDDLDFFL